MIGQVSTTAPHQTNFGGVYINSINGSTVKVRNTDLDFRVIVEERLLASAVRENKHLRAGSSIDDHPTQKDRVISFGMGITAVNYFSQDDAARALINEACELSPRAPSGTLKSDPAMLKRGEDAILTLVNNKNNFTDTTYASGIRLGHGMGLGELDPTRIEHFAAFLTLSMPMKKTQQNEAENTISTSVPALRKVFEPE